MTAPPTPWFQAGCEDWEALAESLTGPWPDVAIRMDLRYHQSRAIRPVRPTAFPTRSALSQRWGLSEKVTRRHLDTFFVGDQSHITGDRLRAWHKVMDDIQARRGPGKGQDGARKGPDDTRTNADNSQESGQDRARIGPGKGLTRGEIKSTEIDQQPPVVPLAGGRTTDEGDLGPAVSAVLDELLSQPASETGAWMCPCGSQGCVTTSEARDDLYRHEAPGSPLWTALRQGLCPSCGQPLDSEASLVDVQHHDPSAALLGGLLVRRPEAVAMVVQVLATRVAGYGRGRSLTRLVAPLAERLARRRAGRPQESTNTEQIVNKSAEAA